MDGQPKADGWDRNGFSILDLLFQGEKRLSLLAIGILLALSFLILSLKLFILPSVDSSEPPVLQPTLPIFGHAVSMIKERGRWHRRLYYESSLPICTLPMPLRKIYLINAPDLISAALENPDISIHPYLVNFSCAVFGLSEEARQLIDCQHAVDGLLDILIASLKGAPLDKLSLVSLSNLMRSLNRLESDAEVNVPDVYDWAWGLMGRTTMAALYGNNSPISPDDLRLIQTFDRGTAGLSLGVMPQLVAHDALKAQRQLKQRLEFFYTGQYDKVPNVSEVIKKRANFFRDLGFDNQDLAGMELAMPWLGTAGPANSLFWLFVHVFSSPDYLQRIRAEMEAITTVTDCDEGRVVTISTKRVNIQCPFLHACFREVLRKYTHFVSYRRVMNDTTIKDTQGNQYSLKKGIDIQWSTSVTNMAESIWDNDSSSFVPERFLNITLEDEKRRRGSCISIGGSKQPFPGRHLALTENLGFVGVLAVGFDVEGAHVPDSKDPLLGIGSRTPVFDSKKCNVKIKRRHGWEDVIWKFVE